MVQTIPELIASQACFLLKAFTSDLTHWKSPIAYILLILMPKITCIIGKASKIGPNK